MQRKRLGISAGDLHEYEEMKTSIAKTLEKDSELNRKISLKTLMISLFSTVWKDHEFYLLSVAHFCATDDDVFPGELAMGKFSITKGLIEAKSMVSLRHKVDFEQYLKFPRSANQSRSTSDWNSQRSSNESKRNSPTSTSTKL
jgi:hypothetical protein